MPLRGPERAQRCVHATQGRAAPYLLDAKDAAPCRDFFKRHSGTFKHLTACGCRCYRSNASPCRDSAKRSTQGFQGLYINRAFQMNLVRYEQFDGFIVEGSCLKTSDSALGAEILRYRHGFVFRYNHKKSRSSPSRCHASSSRSVPRCLPLDKMAMHSASSHWMGSFKYAEARRSRRARCRSASVCGAANSLGLPLLLCSAVVVGYSLPMRVNTSSSVNSSWSGIQYPLFRVCDCHE